MHFSSLSKEIFHHGRGQQHVFRAIQSLRTIRIVVDVPIELLAPGNYLASAFDSIKLFTTSWKEHYAVREIVVDIYPRHAYIVIDINNHRYDFELAHLQHFTIPVHILRLSRKSKN